MPPTNGLFFANTERLRSKLVLAKLQQRFRDTGATVLDDPRTLQISPFDSTGTPLQLVKEFGGRVNFERAVHEVRSPLYAA